ncbi:MAG: pyridoxal phosphate-dependent aminotransferase [Burkholderiales bacterium]|nr:pyridoxal phosphate-dependent aminotransferase [Burkholderiales bacterium]
MNAGIAARMADIEPFHVMAILARARALEAAGHSVIHMEVGEPDFATPQPIIDAGIAAIAQRDMHYTPAAGLPILREAIARFYQTRYGISVDPAHIIVTPGASGALLLALGVLLSPGDEVLLADPGYPCNRHFVRLLEGRPINIPVGPQTDYQLSARSIDAHWRPRTVAALLSTPSNPTGTLVREDEMAEIARCVAARGGQLIVDEIYHGLTYGEDAATALSVDPAALIVNSFSKYFQMTGWRLGWLVAPVKYTREAEKLAQNIFLAPSTPAQYAALAAFEPATIAILEKRRSEFEARRDYLLPALQTLGFNIPVTPAGAFYLYADCSGFTDDSFAFAKNLLEQAYVAITPGADFGHHAPERHVRFAYTTTMAKLAEGVERIGRFLRSGRGQRNL